ncbi:hypothetical protein JHK87_033697 [Glycine soja]|nr:hypothetical protein JHK87_033697 [Glycine soja]
MNNIKSYCLWIFSILVERTPEEVEDLDLSLCNLQAIDIASNDFSEDISLEKAWRMWKAYRALELIDSNLGDSYVVSEVFGCMHVSLLCAQQHPDHRPTMDSDFNVRREMELVEPKEPDFISENVSSGLGLRTKHTYQSLTSQMAISLLDKR